MKPLFAQGKRFDAGHRQNRKEETLPVVSDLVRLGLDLAGDPVHRNHCCLAAGGNGSFVLHECEDQQRELRWL